MNINPELCIRCKGRGYCKKPCIILARIKQFQPKVSTEFSGSSPPEIFVGHNNYPNVFTGILSPNYHGNTEHLSMPEFWHANKDDITTILGYRASMIYSRFKSNIKSVRTKQKNKLLDVMREISLTSKPVDASFVLKQKPISSIHLDSHSSIIANSAFLKYAKIDSNVVIEKKTDYLANDADVHAVDAINELYKSRISVSGIIKMLSAGMLGLKYQRKLVPTRWAITSVDDTISKQLLKKIKTYPQISEILLFNANYLGNYYEILLLPNLWGFEVIEASQKGYFGSGTATWHDYEFFNGRKNYASSVTGAYYSNRLAVSEYLEKIKKQASCLILREIREEYWAPLGVGILREATREAFQKKPEKFDNVDDAFKSITARLKTNLDVFLKESKILKNFREQKKLKEFF